LPAPSTLAKGWLVDDAFDTATALGCSGIGICFSWAAQAKKVKASSEADNKFQLDFIRRNGLRWGGLLYAAIILPKNLEPFFAKFHQQYPSNHQDEFIARQFTIYWQIQ
jgi:hypothetical protein